LTLRVQLLGTSFDWIMILPSAGRQSNMQTSAKDLSFHVIVRVLDTIPTSWPFLANLLFCAALLHRLSLRLASAFCITTSRSPAQSVTSIALGPAVQYISIKRAINSFQSFVHLLLLEGRHVVTITHSRHPRRVSPNVPVQYVISVPPLFSATLVLIDQPHPHSCRGQ
jgi:hypothetical protein